MSGIELGYSYELGSGRTRIGVLTRPRKRSGTVMTMAPITRRGMIMTRGGRTSHPPFVRATTSPIPRGHGLVRGVIHMSRMHRGMGRVAIVVVWHVTDCGSSRYGMKGVVMGRECMRDESKIE